MHYAMLEECESEKINTLQFFGEAKLALLPFPAKSLLQHLVIKVTGGLPCICTVQSIYTVPAESVIGRHRHGLWRVNRAMSYLLLSISGIINCNFTSRTSACMWGAGQVYMVRLQCDNMVLLCWGFIWPFMKWTHCCTGTLWNGAALTIPNMRIAFTTRVLSGKVCAFF